MVFPQRKRSAITVVARHLVSRGCFMTMQIQLWEEEPLGIYASDRMKQGLLRTLRLYITFS